MRLRTLASAGFLRTGGARGYNTPDAKPWGLLRAFPILRRQAT